MLSRVQLRRRHAVLHRRVLGRQAERVPAHRHQHVHAGHAQLARQHVVDGVVAHMAHVQPAARVRQHRAGVELRPARVLGDAVDVGRGPRAWAFCSISCGSKSAFMRERCSRQASSIIETAVEALDASGSCVSARWGQVPPTVALDNTAGAREDRRSPLSACRRRAVMPNPRRRSSAAGCSSGSQHWSFPAMRPGRHGRARRDRAALRTATSAASPDAAFGPSSEVASDACCWPGSMPARSIRRAAS